MKAVTADNPPAKSVFMVQREVADRICAAPGGRDYGAVSVAVQYRCTAKRAIDVSREVFIPRPRVDSAVVLLEAAPGRRGVPRDEELFLRTVKAGFGQRRKMLRNALSGIIPLPADRDDAFARAGVDPGARAETLSVEQFIALSDAICDILYR
jgi:16S rRNA (adenine1518-N6/adenine1519-N6)-dimethyltransferase